MNNFTPRAQQVLEILRVHARIPLLVGCSSQSLIAGAQEIEALETMALNPIRFLVIPRFLALLVMLPCLTVIADLMGIFGGFLVTQRMLAMYKKKDK